MNKVTVISYIIWNLFVFFTYYIDKEAAVNGNRRIPESNLIAFAVFFGGIGAYAGMKLFHHKTQHSKFMIIVPIAMIIQLVVIYSFIRTQG